MYDIIGDVHGQATLLERLLKRAGYNKRGNNYHHHERKAIFVGDFVNRGPEIKETLRIIRHMADAGNALAILGNHEINALLFSMKNDQGESLLLTTGQRYASVIQTFQQFKNYQEEWKEFRKWLRSLPLFLELDTIRVVHACWKDENIEVIKREIQPGRISKSILRNLVIDSKSELSQSILQTTRGIHHILPSDLRIYDNRHRAHHIYRVKWWVEPQGFTFQEWSFESKFKLPNYTIPQEIIPIFNAYPEDAPIVFFGHYCRGSGPWVIKDNVCCVDACVSGKGTLAAYCWDGETTLSPEKMIFARLR
jgi:hypothetical protein